MTDEDVLARLRNADPCAQQPRYDDAVLAQQIRAITGTTATDERSGLPARVAAMDARRGSRGHRLAPVLAAAVVVAVVLGVLLAVHHSGPQADHAEQNTSSSGSARQHTDVQPSAVPAAPAGFTANEFRMAPTESVVGTGGVPSPRPTCRRQQITATAATRRTDGGVLGVIHLVGSIVRGRTTGSERCSLPVARGPSKLIAADGQALTVPLSPGDTTNPPDNASSGVALNDGKVSWGFAWLGSHCGAPAAAIVMPLQPAQGSLHIELHGPQPRCTATTRTSRLIDGIIGFPGEPVQPPRPEYSMLRLTGRITPGTTTDQLAPIEATLHTMGTSPVTLDPCPSYAGRDTATARSGGFSDPLTSGHLACDKHAITIGPGRPLHWTIPATSLVQTPGTGAIPGSKVSVELDVAGVPRVELSTTVRS